MKCQCFKSKAIFLSVQEKNWEFPGLSESWTSLRSCKPTSPLSIAMCSPTLLHPLVPKTCPITYPLANHVSPFPREQIIPTAVYQSSSQLTFLSNTAESFLQSTSAQFVQFIHCCGVHPQPRSSLGLDLSPTAPGQGAPVPTEQNLTWDSQVLF